MRIFGEDIVAYYKVMVRCPKYYLNNLDTYEILIFSNKFFSVNFTLHIHFQLNEKYQNRCFVKSFDATKNKTIWIVPKVIANKSLYLKYCAINSADYSIFHNSINNSHLTSYFSLNDKFPVSVCHINLNFMLNKTHFLTKWIQAYCICYEFNFICVIG